MNKGDHIKIKKLSTYGMKRKKLIIGKVYQIQDKHKLNNDIFIDNEKGQRITISVCDFGDIELLPQNDKCDFSLNTYQIMLDEALLNNDIEWAKELHDKYIGIISK